MDFQVCSRVYWWGIFTPDVCEWWWWWWWWFGGGGLLSAIYPEGKSSCSGIICRIKWEIFVQNISNWSPFWLDTIGSTCLDFSTVRTLVCVRIFSSFFANWVITVTFSHVRLYNPCPVCCIQTQWTDSTALSCLMFLHICLKGSDVFKVSPFAAIY